MIETYQKPTTAKDKQAWKNVEIQPRDIRLLSLILHQKFMTLGQIHSTCFAGLSLQMPLMRIRKLRHFGFIEPKKVYTESRQIYVLARAGYHWLEAHGLSRNLGFLNEIDLRVFEHDKAVTELRLALESAGIGSWISERELKMERSGPRVPDAIFGLNGRRIALEFENADKGTERYRNIFLTHLENRVADHVLYVIRVESKLKALPAVLESLRQKRLGLDLGRISFSLEKEVMERKLEARVINLRQGDALIGSLCRN